MSRPHRPRSDLLAAAESELDAAGFKYRFEWRRKHQCLLVEVNGREEPLFFSNTPSDHRAFYKSRSFVRRQVKAWLAEVAAASSVSQPREEEMKTDCDVQNPASLETIEVMGRQIAKVEYNGQRVVTLRQIDEAHEKAQGQARKQFNAHKHRFVESVDYYVLDSIRMSEFRTLAPNVFSPDAKHGMLFTERGYGKIVKGWNDDLSWQLHDAMQEAYFAVKNGLVPFDRQIDTHEYDAILDCIVAANQDAIAAFNVTSQNLLKGVEDGKAAVLSYLKKHVKAPLETLHNENRGSIQKANQALARRMEDLEHTVTDLMRRAEQPLLMRSFVLNDWYDHDRIYQEFFPNQAIPNRRFLSQAISKSLDAFCKARQRGADMQSRRLGGRTVNLWHKDSVLLWIEMAGRNMIQEHVAKHRSADGVVVPLEVRK